MRKTIKPTLAEHCEMANAICEAEAALRRVLGYSRFYYARESGALVRAGDNLSRLKSRLEDVMFHNAPWLGNEWLRLYYGRADDRRALEGALGGGHEGGAEGVNS